MARSQVRNETVRRRQPPGPVSKPVARARGYRSLTIGRAGLPRRAIATVPASVHGAPVWIHRCSSRQNFLNCGRELICFSASADSFFKKNAGCATGHRGWRGEKTSTLLTLQLGIDWDRQNFLAKALLTSICTTRPAERGGPRI